MKKYMDILKNCRLFAGADSENISAMLGCLEARVQTYKKNESIFSEGSEVSHMGIILSGTAQIIRMDFYGNRSIVAALTPPELFGESFACAGKKLMPISVTAETDCEVMLVDSERILQPCSSACEFHSKIIFNLMKSIAAKNLILNQKIDIISKRTTREKLMTYLMIQAKQHGSSFNIPYNRQELADFLEVDRSGLSSEIGRLRNEGIIECKKSHFKLL